MKKNSIVIITSKRTAIGSYKKSLSGYDAKQLASLLIKAWKQQYTLLKIDELFLGNVLGSYASGQNIARQIAINSGLGDQCIASVTNFMCGSSIKALEQSFYKLMHKPNQIHLIIGSESMSNTRQIISEGEVIESLYRDGLEDAFNGLSMAEIADQFATKNNLDLQAINQYALLSQTRAKIAQDNNYFKEEIIPLEQLTQDEGIRKDTSLEKISAVKKIKENFNYISAANSSSLNDGAAMLVCTSLENAQKLNLNIQAEILDIEVSAGKNTDFLIEPINSINSILKNNQLSIEDIDLWEINEAFAAQIVYLREQLNIDINKLNIVGGAISLGHPIATSGVRIIVTLAHQLARLNLKYGIASLCVGGGMSATVLIRNYQR